MDSVNKALRLAFTEGSLERQENPAEYEGADNYFIYLAYEEGQSHRRLFGSLYDHNQRLAEIAKEFTQEKHWLS